MRVISMKKMVQIDWKQGMLYKDGFKVGVWRRDAAHMIQVEYEKLIGPATRAIFHEAAREVITDLLINHIHKHRKMKGESIDRFVKSQLELFWSLGFGKPELVFVNPGASAARVRFRNSFNAFGYEKMDKPVCYILEGYLERMFEVAFNKRVRCRESRCEAMGDRFCEFDVYSMKKSISIDRNLPKPPGGLDDIEIDISEDSTIHSSGLSLLFVPRGLQKRLEMESEKIIGSATKGIWYSIGRLLSLEFVGRTYLKSLPARIMCKLSKKRFIEKLEWFCQIFSFGRTEWFDVNLRECTATVKVWNCWNAEGLKGSKKPMCYLMSGIIAGANDIIFGRTMKAEEFKCKGMGHPCCEFRLFPAKKDD